MNPSIKTTGKYEEPDFRDRQRNSVSNSFTSLQRPSGRRVNTNSETSTDYLHWKDIHCVSISLYKSTVIYKNYNDENDDNNNKKTLTQIFPLLVCGLYLSNLFKILQNYVIEIQLSAHYYLCCTNTDID